MRAGVLWALVALTYRGSGGDHRCYCVQKDPKWNLSISITMWGTPVFRKEHQLMNEWAHEATRIMNESSNLHEWSIFKCPDWGLYEEQLKRAYNLHFNLRVRLRVFFSLGSSFFISLKGAIMLHDAAWINSVKVARDPGIDQKKLKMLFGRTEAIIIRANHRTMVVHCGKIWVNYLASLARINSKSRGNYGCIGILSNLWFIELHQF